MDFTNIFLSNFYKDNDFFSHTRVRAPKSNDLERFRHIWATNGVFWVLKRWRNRKNKGDRKNKDIKGFKDILGRHTHTTESAYRPRDVLVTPNAQKTQISERILGAQENPCRVY